MHTWRPIEDLPDGHVRLASGQLATLRAAWQSRRRELEGSAALERFVQRMVRQWSIQTGLIERL
ncbi:MAG: hypothetical protein R3F56_17060 [Planctomycetota bacterium]